MRAAEPEWGELARQVRDDDLRDLVVAGDASKLMGPEFDEPRVLRKVVGDVFAGRTGGKCLTAVPGRPKARDQVDIHPDVALVAELWFSDVKPDPDANRNAIGPSVITQAPVDGQRGRGGLRTHWKNGEKLIGPRVNLATAVRSHHGTNKPALLGEDVAIPGPELIQERRRPLDVGVQERDAATR